MPHKILEKNKFIYSKKIVWQKIILSYDIVFLSKKKTILTAMTNIFAVELIKAALLAGNHKSTVYLPRVKQAELKEADVLVFGRFPISEIAPLVSM